MERPAVLILGKLPPPYMGPAVATKIILESGLKQRFDLHHFDTRINTSVADMGRFKLSKLSTIRALYTAFRQKLQKVKPVLVLIPIGQTAAGFFKDLPFIRMAAASGAKVLVQLRGSEFRDMYEGLDPLRKMVIKHAFRKIDSAIVLGENLRYIFEGMLLPERIHVVPNGGDFHFPKRIDHALRVTYLANCLPGKGLKELLQALDLLAKEGGLPSFEFCAYGSWDNAAYRAECEAIAAQAHMAHCHFMGPVSGDAKWQALANSDIFVFAPKSPEGHPWSLIEASAAGLPIISTDRGAIAQNVIDGNNGFLLPHPEPALLAEVLRKLIIDRGMRKDMGRGSRLLYEAKFTEARMVERLGDVMEEAIKSAIK